MKVIEFNKEQYVSTSDAKDYLKITIHDLYNTIGYHKTLETVKIGHGRFVALKSLKRVKRNGKYAGRKQ